MVGYNELFRQSEPSISNVLVDQAAPLNQGPFDQRLAYIVLIGELAGPAGSRKLADLDQRLAHADHGQSENLLKAETTLKRLYTDYEDGRLNGPSVDEQDRASLRSTLRLVRRSALEPRGGEEALVGTS